MLPLDTRDIRTQAAQNPATGEFTGFAENLFSAFDQFRRENLSVSEVQQFGQEWDKQLELAKKHGIDTTLSMHMTPSPADITAMQAQPGIPSHVYFLNKRNDEFRKLKAQYPDAGFKTNEELFEGMVERLAKERGTAASVRARATGFGSFGAGLGDVSGAVSDPLVMLTLPFGAAGSANFLRTVLTEAAIASTTEAVIQPQVAQFRESIGNPQAPGEAVTNVLLAGAGAGTAAAVLKSIPLGYRALLSHYRAQRDAGLLPPATEKERAAEAFLERLTEESDSNPFPKADETNELHAANLAAAERAVAGGELPAPGALRPASVPRETDVVPVPVGDDIVEIPARMQQEIDEALARPITIDMPNREPLRMQTARKAYGLGAAKKERVAHIVLGPPAAGKSSAIADPLADTFGAKIIDSDDIKAMLPEYDNGRGANAVHEESSLIADSVLAHAAQQGDNIVLPLVGKTLTNLRERVQSLRQQGYSVFLHHVDLPLNKAVRRGVERYQNSGRLVAVDFIAGIGNKPLKNFEKIIKEGEINGWSKWSNDVEKGQRPRLLEQEKFAGQQLHAGLGRTGGEGPQIRSGQSPGRQSVREQEFLKAYDANPQAVDDIVAAETARILEETPDFKLPVGEKIDPDTGEVVQIFKTARELLDDLKEDDEALAAVTGCLIGGAVPAAAAV